MHMNEMFPSRYLKASDLQGKDRQLVVEAVEMVQFDEGHRPVAHFRGAEKGLVLNRTNANVIADGYGPDTDKWIGQAVTLYPARVDYKGRMVDAIRCRVDQSQPPAPATAPVPADDDIPF